MAYATLQDIFLRWGETNVRDAANLNSGNPKSATVTKRIKYFLEIQSHEIEARLLGCAYKVPFDPVPPVIRTLCAELAYISMYRVRHSQDDTSTDPFIHITARHNQIFADIHARRFRLGAEQHSVDIPLVVGGKPPKVTAKILPAMTHLAKIHTDGTLHGDGTENNPLSVVQSDLAIDLPGINVSQIPHYAFVAIGANGLVEASEANHKVIGIRVGEAIITRGVVQNDHWSWETGKYVMLGQNGLTQTASTTLVRVGIALSPKLLMLKFEYGFL